MKRRLKSAILSYLDPKHHKLDELWLLQLFINQQVSIYKHQLADFEKERDMWKQAEKPLSEPQPPVLSPILVEAIKELAKIEEVTISDLATEVHMLNYDVYLLKEKLASLLNAFKLGTYLENRFN
ncbi:hypothetical protein GCM10023189_16320 [Nibrella saemangeumensis]|uniref:Uncharacterized protein n=1 Tax=Nibrella saemangeumensis TaxID=1084526 RepID=A0ABP8MQ44_9BACT